MKFYEFIIFQTLWHERRLGVKGFQITMKLSEHLRLLTEPENMLTIPDTIQLTAWLHSLSSDHFEDLVHGQVPLPNHLDL